MAESLQSGIGDASMLLTGESLHCMHETSMLLTGESLHCMHAPMTSDNDFTATHYTYAHTYI